MRRSVVFLLAAALLTTSLEVRAQSYDDVEEEEEATAKEKAEKQKADKEKANKQKADKQKAGKQKAGKQKADKEKADKQKADARRATKAASDGIEVSEEPDEQEPASVEPPANKSAKADAQRSQKKQKAKAKAKAKAKKPKSQPAPVANKTAEKTTDAVPGTAAPSSMPRLLGLSLPVWLCGGGAVLFGVAAGVTGGLAVAKNSEYQDANTGLNPTAADELRSTGQTLNIVTDVLLGASALSAGAGVALFFLDGGPARFMTGTLVPAVTHNGASLHWYSQF